MTNENRKRMEEDERVQRYNKAMEDSLGPYGRYYDEMNYDDEEGQ